MNELKAVAADAASGPAGTIVVLRTERGSAQLAVPPPGRWRTRANRALRQGDFDEWSELVLSGEDSAAWAELDPTNDDVEAFFISWRDATGEDPKRSASSIASSPPTPKR